MIHAFRLKRGEDLLLALRAFAGAHAIEAAVPVCCVGCLTRWRIRCADGMTAREAVERVEIVSLTGTLSTHGCHLHISLAREDLSVIGGHLLEGCIVNTTAEVVLQALDGLTFTRKPDVQTGYRELEVGRDA